MYGLNIFSEYTTNRCKHHGLEIADFWLPLTGCILLSRQRETHFLLRIHRYLFIYFLFIKIHQPDKNIHTVNAVKQAENRLVEWPTQG